uniref:Uncharacterized protein n=1 Tax=Anguilla anguilla TaxID=7936 RepID=A0A0E9W728_ANGAN
MSQMLVLSYMICFDLIHIDSHAVVMYMLSSVNNGRWTGMSPVNSATYCISAYKVSVCVFLRW